MEILSVIILYIYTYIQIYIHTRTHKYTHTQSHAHKPLTNLQPYIDISLSIYSYKTRFNWFYLHA